MTDTDQNFNKKLFYRSETQEKWPYRSENQQYFFFSPFFQLNYFWIQISDLNLDTCSKNRIARSVDFRRVPANGSRFATGSSDTSSYIFFIANIYSTIPIYRYILRAIAYTLLDIYIYVHVSY